MIPYGRQSIDKDDIEAVVETLQSDYLTQGKKINEFENDLAAYCGSKYAVVVANGTAALHAAYFAADLKSGDEFITSPMTFVATTNAGVWQDARPILTDIDLKTGNIDVETIEEKITSKTKAIVPIDYTGRSADLDKIKEIAKKYSLIVIEDACQALGAHYGNRKIGSISDMSVFSFHPVKSITTGEGGAILTDNEDYYRKMKKFITHGITKDNFENETHGDWYCEMQCLGQNYRLTDFQCALGISQLKKLDRFIEKRRNIAKKYDAQLRLVDEIILPVSDDEKYKSAWHLYVIRLKDFKAGKKRELFDWLRKNNIGAQVHHVPVHLHPYYHKTFGFNYGMMPNAEQWYESAITLPIYPNLKEEEQDFAINKIKEYFV